MSEVIKEISTDIIDDPHSPMRTEMDRNELFELADNIKYNGLINPITVRPIGKRYEVVAGHRRLSACRIAGLVKIPCVVRDLDDNKTFEVMAAENLERADVNPVDEAIFLTKYIESTGKEIPDVAKSIRRSISYVESRLAVGQMPEYMQEYLKTGQLKLGAALHLAQITDDPKRRMWVDLAVRDGISVAQAEFWLHGWKVNQLPGGSQNDDPPTGFAPGSPQTVQFECAIDGQKYDARQFRTLLIYEGNLDFFNSIVTEFRNHSAQS